MAHRPAGALLLLLAAPAACGNFDGTSRADRAASCRGVACATTAADGSPFFDPPVMPVVVVDLPTCPDASLLPLPAGTDPNADIEVSLYGPCTRFCTLYPTTECDDAGVSWSTQTVCTCLGGAPWSCSSYYPNQPSSCGAPAYACPTEPVLLAEDAAVSLPAGRCNANDGCTLRARQRCADGSTGLTTAYGCYCPQVEDAGFGEWACHAEWSTATGCNGPVEAGSAASADAGGYWIEVQGDGPTYVMTSGLRFADYEACDIDANLSGCVGPTTVPCLATDVTPGNHGKYTDRQGNYWTLTSVSIQPAVEGGAIGGASADGTLVLTAVDEEGGTMQLVLTFHTPYEAYIC
jgi:hypothetical protein